MAVLQGTRSGDFLGTISARRRPQPAIQPGRRHGNHTGDFAPIIDGPMRKTLKSISSAKQKSNNYPLLNYHISINYQTLAQFFSPLLLWERRKISKYHHSLAFSL